MKKEIISPVAKNKSSDDAQTTNNSTSGCCGSTPLNKEEGSACQTPKAASMKTSCC